MKNKKNKTIFFTALVLLLAACFGYAGRSYLARTATVGSATTAPAPEPVPQPQIDPIVAAQEANSAGLSPQAADAANTTAKAQFVRVYTNTVYGFSFKYPETLKIGADQEGDADTIIAQDAAAHVGFQIYITPWSGGDITAQMVRADLPALDVQSPQEISFAGVSAFAFLATDKNFGSSRQVWFSHGGHLYQLSTYSSQDSLLEKVLGTWRIL